MTKYILTFFSLLFVSSLFAQAESAVTSNNFMLSNHKVFVSVAVLTIILLIIFAFLFWIERRLAKLEGQTKS